MTTQSNSQALTPQIARQKKLSSILPSLGLDALVLNAGPSLTYLTGLHFHLSERPVVCIFTTDRNPVILLPVLEQEKLKGLAYPLEGFTYGEDPAGWSSVFKRAVQAANITGKCNGIEPRQLRLLEYLLLVDAASTEAFIPAEDCVASLRMFKDEGEITCMRKAARIAEQALTATLPYIKIGTTEKEVATELTLQLFRAGCDPQMPFTPIVSAGPNSANPHATVRSKTYFRGSAGD
jgi:Xaa-Pro dipeptidase